MKAFNAFKTTFISPLIMTTLCKVGSYILDMDNCSLDPGCWSTNDDLHIPTSH